MSGTVLMSLGKINFYVPFPNFDTPSFDSRSRDTNFSWIAQPRLSRGPAMQFTGAGEDTITIEGKLYPNHFGGMDTLSALRAAGNDGKPLMLKRFHPLEGGGAEGIPIGTYVIKRVRQAETRIGVNGQAHKVDFTLELTAYGDDVGVTNQAPEVIST